MTEEMALSDGPGTPDGVSGGASDGAFPEAHEIREELQRILGSREFKNSKRCIQFLEYVVEQTLAGLPNGLKERTIGVEVFGRSVTYDTNVEGVVRIRASEVRKRLALYYGGTGMDSGLRIELPVGTYVPCFAYAEVGPRHVAPCHVPPLAPPSAEVGGAPPSVAHPGKRPRWWFAAVSCVLLVGILSGMIWHHRRTPAVFEAFWAPLFDQKRPVLIAAAYAPVYVSAIDGDPKSPKDILPLRDQFVGGGDLVAAARLAGMFAGSGHAYEVRVGQGVAFEDLREGPSVLIGYSSNHWSEMTRELRFYIDDSGQSMIRDHGRPTTWYPNLAPDYHTNEDFAIVARAVLPQTHTPVVLVTGCTHYGTEAAARLVTQPQLLVEALKDAPKGWQHMNLELVLRIKVIANAPATPEVIATHYW